MAVDVRAGEFPDFDWPERVSSSGHKMNLMKLAEDDQQLRG